MSGASTRAGGGGSGQHDAREPAANQRFSNLIHDSEVFLTKLREFKPQSLGCLEARRKSSSTLIFPSPQQACMGPPKCPRYPHSVKPTPGYWIECHGPGFVADHKAPGAQASGGQEAHGKNSAIRVGGQEEGGFKLNGSASMGEQLQEAHQLPSIVRARVELEGDRQQQQQQQHHQQRMQQQQQQAQDLGLQLEAALRRRQSAGDQPSHEALLALQASSELPGAAQEGSRAAGGTSGNKKCDAVQGAGAAQVGGQARRTGSTRRRLHKRTMTRDDIDLHKSRRGMPNITITEPSFNQSISLAHQRGPGLSMLRQSSQGAAGELKRLDSSESGQSGESQAVGQRPQPIKFQIQRYTSIEAQPARDDGSAGETRGGGAGEPRVREFTIESEDSPKLAESPDLAVQLQQQQQQPAQGQRHHRPSVIREDVASEASTSHNAPQAAQEAQAAAWSKQQHEIDEHGLYCGLSTTEFNKKPYQQAYLEQQNLDQFRDSSLELISFEEENYEKHYYGREHWNYFTNDELLGPVMLSLKQEVNNQRDHFHVLLRTVSYTLHGTIPASTICADRYDREAIVRELSEIAKLKPPLMPGQLPSTPDELLKLDHIFIKTELKVGVIYIKAGQEESEESILGNKEESPLFGEFLDLLGDRITLKGFDRYKGGLDTVHNLTGTESVYTMWRNIEIMFHVSTMLPHEENDPQKLQKKRHIGNDIVCVAFIESDDTLFWPGCIKSYFLHTFIAVRTSPKPVKEGERRKYYVSCVCRNEVQYAFRPYLVERDDFFKSDYFREWLLVKIVNGERASYSAPKFARMQDRTRSQLLEDIITNLANHLVTGQIPKPYRRGSWRPLGHTRASSPLEDSMKDYFEDYEQLAKDFANAFCGPSKSVLCDVVFKVKDADGSFKLVHGVRAILAIRSRTFLEMLYGFVPSAIGSSGLQSQTNLRAIELKALGEPGALAGKESEQHSKSALTKRGSVGTDTSKKIGEKERRQSMLPNLSKTISQKPNYLTVPSTGGGAGAGAGGASGAGGGGGSTSGIIKNAFNRLVTGNWSGWSDIKGYKGEPMHIKVDQNKTKVDLNSLAICKEIAKIDADKLTQREFEIKEFDYETFKQTIEYIHNGQCKLNYETIPGLICAAEHYDLPDLLHACFHHANTHMKLSAAPKMMNALYQNSCFYITAMQLLDAIYDFIDPQGNEFFSRLEYLELYESVLTSLLCRKTLQVTELKRFQAMDGWARQQVANKQQRQLLQRKQSAEIRELGEAGGEQQQAVQAAECKVMSREEAEQEYRNLITRLNKDVNIKLDKISSEDLVKVVLPTKVFHNDRIFEVMADESRDDY